MIRYAKTCNVEIANTKCANEKLPKRRKGQPIVWTGPQKDVTLRMRWREVHQMMCPSESCVPPDPSGRVAMAKSAAED